MHTYDDEIYTYLTRPENYRASKQIASQLSVVDERLVTTFWQEVKAELEKELEPNGWQVDLTAGTWFSVHRVEWKHMGLNCDNLRSQPDFGLHCNPDFYNRQRVDDLLNEAKIRESENMRRSTVPWPCFRPLAEFDFRQQQTLERILPVPGHREEAVKSMVALFTDFVKKYSTTLDYIHEGVLKPNIQN